MTRTDISIHALREEGDVERCKKIILAMSISIHALREEGDLMRVYRMEGDGDFYPRPPRGGRPNTGSVARRDISDFYPRPPRGGRHLAVST